MYQGPVAPVVKSLTPKDSEADGALPSATAILSATSRHACASLRLIATSDLHASLMPYDYCADRPNSSLGLDAIALQIAEARGEARNCLLFDNGDFLQGSPLADYAAASRRRRAHPMITAFNTLGYDAATLGNHEFDYGLRFLSGVLADARFPVVLGQYRHPAGQKPVARRNAGAALRHPASPDHRPRRARPSAADRRDRLRSAPDRGVGPQRAGRFGPDARYLPQHAPGCPGCGHAGPISSWRWPIPALARSSRRTAPRPAATALAALPEIDVLLPPGTATRFSPDPIFPPRPPLSRCAAALRESPP